MGKFVAPANLASFTADTVEYTPDENGHFEIAHPDHIKHAKRHGFKMYDPAAGTVVEEAPPAPIPDEHGNADLLKRLAAADETEADLRRQLDEMQAKLAETTEGRDEALQALADAGARSDATDTAADADDATGDTSETAAATDEVAEDKLGAFLAANPDFTGEDLDRDGKVEWLKGVGVAISVSSSKVAAQTAIETTIADYKRDHAQGE